MITDAGDVEVDHTDHWGVRRTIRIRPLRFFHGANQWHPRPGWLCYAMDTEVRQFRYFAMSGVHSWREVGEEVDPK